MQPRLEDDKQVESIDLNESTKSAERIIMRTRGLALAQTLSCLLF